MTEAQLPIWIMYIAAFLGATCFAILFRVPRRFLIPTVVLGFATCLLMRALPVTIGPGVKSILGSVFVGFFSQLMAKYSGKPAQAFMIPSVIFLVPGRNIYQSFDHLLNREFDMAFDQTVVALLISFGVTFGLMLSNWIIPSKKPL